MGAALLGLSVAGAREATVYLFGPNERSGTYVGSATGGHWKSAEQVAGGSFQGLTLGGTQRKVVMGQSKSSGIPCTDMLYAEMKQGRAARDFEIVTNATHKLQPRPVTLLPTKFPAYEKVIRDELLRRGLKSPKVNLTRVVKADLDGNDSDEVILEAFNFERFSDEQPRAPVGSPSGYSLLLLRSVQAGKVKTDVLGEFKTPKVNTYDQASLPMLYRLAGVADLNGDGRMEIVTFDSYYEGEGYSVLEWRPGQPPVTRLGSGCGA